MFVDPLGLETVGQMIDNWGETASNPFSRYAAAFTAKFWEFFGAEGVSEIADGQKEITVGAVCIEVGMAVGGKYIKPVKIISKPIKPFVPDGYWKNHKLPLQTTPGIRTINRTKLSKNGELYHQTGHYDEFGRNIGSDVCCQSRNV